MLENARAYLRRKRLDFERVGFERANCTDLPHADGSIDLFVSSYLFDLLSREEIERAIREMERVLRPDGHAILITMTTELDDVWLPLRVFYRFTNEFYCVGYTGGRWNGIWRFLCSNYAPHCRPIALGGYLRRFQSLVIEYTKISHVSLFPVRIYYIRKSHG
jgi:ubiquinone/menaquinone biosynthesis C-methylase UbiE